MPPKEFLYVIELVIILGNFFFFFFVVVRYMEKIRSFFKTSVVFQIFKIGEVISLINLFLCKTCLG